MIKKCIFSEKAPAAIGPYSQAVQKGNTIYVSGQLPVNPETGKFPSDCIEDQTRQSLLNVREILKEAGATMEDVVKTTVFLQDIGDFTAMNNIYAEFFKAECPARAAFQVAALPMGARVEIEVVAVVD
jgi:2-iminobutanoate/2-iminopropanoate deaminase